MGKIYATREHEIACGHRVYGHENKCSHLHGHNYKFKFYVTAKDLDTVGRVVDFSVIKSTLCEWLEKNYDHKFLVYDQDPWSLELSKLDPDGVRIVPYNPTAENIAKFLVEVVGPKELPPHLLLEKVEVWETGKCTAIYSKEEDK